MTPEALKAIGPRQPYDMAIPNWNNLTHTQRACIESLAALEWWRGYHAAKDSDKVITDLGAARVRRTA